jgi:hypothetical protein
MKPIESINYRGHIIEIHQDEDGPNPRTDYDNAATMICWHRNYDLGDKKKDFSEPSQAEAFFKEHNCIVLPLYLYDHSGITMSTGPFSCPWDSGQVGYIYMTRKKALKEYGKKILTKQLRAKIEKYMQGEVETYDSYLRGEAYGFIVKDKKDEEIESCWGFLGDMKYCIDEAKSTIDCAISYNLKKHIEQVKTWIKNKVPLNNRRIFSIA